MERKVFHLFKHLLLAGSRVGTGNIAGVATAIVLGSWGSFWMWIIAFIGAASAFIEATLHKFTKFMIKKVASEEVQLIT